MLNAISGNYKVDPVFQKGITHKKKDTTTISFFCKNCNTYHFGLQMSDCLLINGEWYCKNQCSTKKILN